MKEWTREEKYRVLGDPEEIRDLHENIQKSNYRQIFHVQPVTGLLNDPNGFVYHNGEWHLFYQWCPWGAVHGLKYWYHVVSKDLIKWENLGVCIRPDTEYDNKGAYSGSALPTGDALYLYYTGNHRDRNWLRTPYTLVVALKDNGEPEKILPPLFGPEAGYTEHQRDPKIIFNEENQTYYIIIGAQTYDKHGCILVYRSKDPLEGWEFAGQLKVSGFEDFGSMWECPSIERISGKDILIFCPQHLKLDGRGDSIHHNGYILGRMDFDTLTFYPDGSFHVLDFGFDSYAAECAAQKLMNKNAAVLVAWMGLPDAAYPVTDEEEWSGCLTLPRELTIRGRRLIQKPLESLKKLRGEAVDPAKHRLPRECEMEVICGNEAGVGDAAGADSLVDRLTLDVSRDNLMLSLFTKPDGSGGLHLTFEARAGVIEVDRSDLTNRFNTQYGEVRSRPLEAGLRHLRIFIDSSSVEIFVNDGDAVFTSRVFPTEEEHGFALEGRAEVKIWTLEKAVRDDFVV